MVEGGSLPHDVRHLCDVSFTGYLHVNRKFVSSRLLRLLFHRKLPVKKISWISVLLVGVALLLYVLVRFTLDPFE